MVQVSGRHYDGSILWCRVHDVLRDLAIQRAKEMNFLTVCSKPDDLMSCNKARRVAINYSLNFNEMMGDYANPNIRSLLLFGKPFKLDCSKYRVLKVLGCMMSWYLMGEKVMLKFKGLPHLRYLKLACEIEGKEHEFGKWIMSMKYLETLDLEGSAHGDLSKWIWQVKTLRHAILDKIYHTQGPPASVDLSNLQTLVRVNYSNSRHASGSPNITKVRQLEVKVHEKYFSEEIITLLHKLEHLAHLGISGISSIDFRKIIWKDFPFYKNLKYLLIITKESIEVADDGNEGVLTTDNDDNKTLVLSDDTLPPHLAYLNLSEFDFVSDSMSVLQKLENLKILTITGSGKENVLSRRFRYSAGGFKQLEELAIYNHKVVDEWEIGTGTMPMLKELFVYNCDPLRVPLELVHLPSLKSLYWDTNIQTNKDVIHRILEQRPDVLLRS